MSLSDEEDQARRSLYDNGLNDKEIADERGVSRGAIRHWRNTRDLPPNTPPPGELDRTPEWGEKRECWKIPLYNNQGELRDHALVSDGDLNLVGDTAWHIDGKGYVVTNALHGDGREAKMHRVILELEPGDGKQADHINRDRLDNRRENLRVSDNQLNKHNLPARDGKSEYRGVSWHEASGKWRAVVTVDGEQHSGGYFDDEEEAAEKAREMRRELMEHSPEAMP